MFGKPKPGMRPGSMGMGKGPSVSILSMGLGKKKKPELEMDVEEEPEGGEGMGGEHDGFEAAKDAAKDEIAGALATKDADGLVEAICNLIESYNNK